MEFYYLLCSELKNIAFKILKSDVTFVEKFEADLVKSLLNCYMKQERFGDFITLNLEVPGACFATITHPKFKIDGLRR